MKRRIILSFFIGLLLLFVGEWVGSYKCWLEIDFQYSNQWNVGCFRGKVNLLWIDKLSFIHSLYKQGVYVHAGPAPALIDGEAYSSYYGAFHYMGFSIMNEDAVKYFAVPFWFPTTLSAALLLLVWRKTRPMGKGRAFPVELEKPIGEQGGKAE